MDNFALAELRAGDVTRAEPLLRRLLEYQRHSGAGLPIIARTTALLGLCLLRQDRAADAEPLLRECLAIREKLTPDDWPRFNAMSLLGGCLLGQKKYDEAEPLIIRGYEGMNARASRIPAAAHYLLSEAAGRIIGLYVAWDRPAQAAEWRAKLGPALKPKTAPAAAEVKPRPRLK